MNSPCKKVRIDADTWICNAVYLLEHAPSNTMKFEQLCEATGYQPSEHITSLIVEHPSLVLQRGRVCLSPFCAVRCSQALLKVLRDAFPRAFRRTDLLGLYTFVNADVDELLFESMLDVVDPKATSTAVYACPREEVVMASEGIRDLWRSEARQWGENARHAHVRSGKHLGASR